MIGRLILGVVAVSVVTLLLAWWAMIRMPGKSFAGTLPPLTAEETALRTELAVDVQRLGGEIGERNLKRYQELGAAADFIERSFDSAGLRVGRDRYEMRGQSFDNIEGEIRGTQPGIVVIGAHYDSVVGSPGANDNGSGVAALLALARRFAGKPAARTLRFVAFVNEEPFMFQSPEMGSYIYASRCKAAGDKITAMLSLETIGYYSNAPHSQIYPVPGLGRIYPSTGNFIGFVGNVASRALVKEAIGEFRAHAQVPSEGAALPAAVPGIGWSDQWAFWKHGYPGIMITDTAPFRYPYYHSAADTPDKLDYDTMARVVRGLKKVVARLARSQSR